MDLFYFTWNMKTYQSTSDWEIINFNVWIGGKAIINVLPNYIGPEIPTIKKL